MSLFGSSVFSRSRRGSKSKPGRLHLEALEPRVVLTVVITEFQASNGNTLFDEDGGTPDWIELKNTSLETVNLDGWYLTDDPGDFGKWRIPAVELPSDEHLVIFASNKDRSNPASELHTNFQLDSDGEYLALVEPDGITLASEFAPFPPQLRDQSYGLAVGRDTEVFVDSGAAAKAFVPSDDSLGTSWTEIGFNDATWKSGTTAVGYELLESGFNTRDDFDSDLGPEWTVDIPAGGTTTFEVTGGQLSLDVPGNQEAGETRGLAPYFLQDAPELSSDYEIISQVTLSDGAGAAGIVIVDGNTGLPAMSLQYRRASSFISQLQTVTNGNVVNANVQFNTTSVFMRLQRDIFADSWTTSFKKNEADEWSVLTTVVEGVGDVPQISSPSIGLIATTNSGTSLPVTFDFFELSVGDEKEVYAPLTGLDVESEMFGTNPSVYVRIPFEVTNAARFDEMDLGISYDDGYIAYLNGVEVSRRNVPIVSAWDSAASGRFGAVDGDIPFNVFSLNPFADQLAEGPNVLAFQGMNVAVDDGDFYLAPTLSAAEILSTTPQPFTNPTPGVDNLLPAAPEPIITEPGGTFIGSKTVEIENPMPIPSLQIRYTLDGTVPTENSLLYTGPVTLTSSAWLRARIIDTSLNPAFAPSNTASGSYIAIHTELETRDSDLPILVIDTLGQSFPGTDSSDFAASTVTLFDTDPVTGRSQMHNGIVDYSGFGGLRRRGSSTGGIGKPPLAFETWGDLDDDVDVSLLGLPAESDWVLYAPFNFDRTLIHEQFIYDLSNAIGSYVGRTRTIEVYANDDGGVLDEDDYHGVYVLIERIKQGNDRVDVADADFTATYDPNRSVFEQQDPAITGGYIWKIDRSDPGEQPFNAGGYNINWVYPKPQDFIGNALKVTADQQAYATDYINEFWDVLQSPDAFDPVDGYAKYVDVDAWIDHHLLNIVAMNVDAQRLSAYFHKDVNGKIAFGPIWDFDRSMESTDNRDDNPFVWRSEVGDLGTDFFGEAGDGSGGRWWRQMFQDPNFFQKYIDRYHELRQAEFSTEAIDARIDKFADIVREARARDLARWNQQPRTSCFDGCDGTWEGEVENMRNWLHARLGFMDETFPLTPDVSLNAEPLPVTPIGVAVESGAVITATAPDGPPQTIVSDEVLLSGVAGDAAVRYFVPADDSLGTTWTDPAFDDGAWSEGTSGIGYENTPADYADLITTSVRPQDVVPGATTIMTRTEFQVDPANVNDLVVQMKYDDGFVAYLNGTEVARQNVAGTLSWNTSGGGSNPDTSAVIFQDFDITDFKNLLVDGTNVLAVQVVNEGTNSSDLLVLPQVVSREVTILPPDTSGILYYTVDGSDPRGSDGQPSATAVELAEDGSIVITENTQVIIRNLDMTDHGPESEIITTDWSAPIKHNFIINPGGDLAITEINYNPVGPSDQEQASFAEHITDEVFEFVEIQNVGAEAVDLDGVRLSNGVQFDFSNTPFESLAAGQRVLVVADQAGFERRYGAGLPIAGEFDGTLSNNGERVTLVDGLDNVLFTTSYSDASFWPQAADGAGATLELTDPAGTTALTSDKYYSWRSSREVGGTPGAAGAGPLGIVINEVLVNTDDAPAVSDSIELLNTSDDSVNIGGWFLSDGSGNFQKFEIPSGTMLAAGEYIVFDESDFNDDPDTGFALSGNDGDDVWLTVPDPMDEEETIWIVDDVHFGGAASLESFGRVPNGSGRLAPMQTTTMGAENSEPRVGPVVITEVQYNPSEPTPEALALYPPLNGGDLEFIELHNPTDAIVDLTDWRIRGGVDLNFDEGTTIAAGETIAVISFNPDNPVNSARVDAFQEFYGITDSVRLVGGFGGQLSDDGDRVELQRAVRPNPSLPLLVAHVIEDEVLFDDLAPWGTNADGQGSSLQRASVDAYGNLAASWTDNGVSIGTFGDVGSGDVNGDGVTNADDIDAVYDAINAGLMDAVYDVDGNGAVDEGDATHLIENILNVFRGDANLDGKVDPQDLNAIGLNWLSNGVGWAGGDFNGDRTVDPLDLNVVGLNWLRGTAPVRSPRAPLVAQAAIIPEAADRVLRFSGAESLATRYSTVEIAIQDTPELQARRPVLEMSQARRRALRSDLRSQSADTSDGELKKLDDLFATLL